MFLDFEEKSNDLMWAIGETGRTSFVWTLAPPGTIFCHGGSVSSEVHYLSLFKWDFPLWSSLDIALDEKLVVFLQEWHSRIEYNQEFQGEDFEAESLEFHMYPKVCARSLPQGNHIISIFLTSGLLEQQMPSRRFRLKKGLVCKTRYQTIERIQQCLQQYFDRVKITREEVEQKPEYLKKIEQMNSRYDMKIRKAEHQENFSQTSHKN